MLRQLLARLVVVSITVFLVVFAFNLSVAGPQEAVKRAPPPQPPIDLQKPENEGFSPFSRPVLRDSARRLTYIDRMIARYDIKPHPAPALPDNPPPHEGAMISDLPYIVEPPDLILVEVLEALPDRPISGERLVRPDGTITLGFYGEVYVKGLTLDQVKVAIIKQLRKHLNDAALGLEAPVLEEELKPSKPSVKKPPIPEPPKEEELFPDAKEKVKPRSSSYRSRPNPFPMKTRSASLRRDRRSVPVRAVGFPETSQEPADPPTPNQIKIPVSGRGRITITIETGGQGVPVAEKTEPAPPAIVEDEGSMEIIPPALSTTVFVDITAYNSKNYYVLGDAQITGRLPWTGNETVLDALNFAGGLLGTAEPKDIHLVRPGRDGKPSKVYKVDLEAIQQKGEVATNYQIFPGDRLVVGRNEVVKKTVEIDRLSAPIQSLAGSILQEAYMLRSLEVATGAGHNEVLKEYVDFWAKELARPGGIKFDEQTLREALIRKMKLPPNPSAPPPASR
jgi:protein involved in polysaccharide export with SLBB domain